MILIIKSPKLIKHKPEFVTINDDFDIQFASVWSHFASNVVLHVSNI